jgi:hypothetical protein
MQVDRGGVELLTKAVQPVLGRIADYNFAQTVDFVASLSRTAEVNLGGVQRLSSRLAGVAPDVRLEFAEMAGRVSARAAIREAPTTASQTPLLAEQPSETELK